MKITRQDVAHIARLSRLRLSEEEMAEAGAHLERILGYVDKLSELDLSGIEPTTHAVSLVIQPRPDRAGDELSPARVLSNAPQAVDGMFCVPKVVDEG